MGHFSAIFGEELVRLESRGEQLPEEGTSGSFSPKKTSGRQDCRETTSLCVIKKNKKRHRYEKLATVLTKVKSIFDSTIRFCIFIFFLVLVASSVILRNQGHKCCAVGAKCKDLFFCFS